MSRIDLSLIKAVRNNDIISVEKLLKYPYLTSYTEKSGDTALIWAVRKNNYQIVKMLLDEGTSNVASTDRYGNTPLILSIKKNNNRIASILLKTGKANVDHVNNKGETALI